MKNNDIYSKEMNEAIEKAIANSLTTGGAGTFKHSIGIDPVTFIPTETTTPASESNRVFSTGSQRDNDDHKPLVNHLAPYLRLRYGYHLRKGANHYGKGNWKLGQPKETAIESLNRHLALYELNDQLGKEQDEDHLAAMIFNIKLIMENEQKAGIQVDHFFKLKHEAKK
jgi:hypothetical protein